MWPANQPAETRDKLRPVRSPNKISEPAGTEQITLYANLIANVLFGITAFIIIVGLLLQLLYYNTVPGNYLLYLGSLFNVDEELNIPSLFSTCLLFGASLLLSAITYIHIKSENKFLRHWLALTLGFLFLAVDESITLHEHLNKPFKALLGDQSSGLFTFAWVVPGIFIVAVVGLSFWKFVLNLPAKTRNGFLTAAFFYIGGAIGVEMLGARYAEQHGLVNLTYVTFTTVEETFEMIGIILFIRALLQYMGGKYRLIIFSFR